MGAGHFAQSSVKEQHDDPTRQKLSLYVVCACCFRENMITIFGGPKTIRGQYKGRRMQV